MLRFLLSLLATIAALVVLVALCGAWILVSTPRPTKIRGCFTTEMNHVHICPKDLTYTAIRSIPHAVKMAVVVSEDGSFYDHNGFDWFELRESFKKDLKTGHFARGGSTITQQLAKNLYLTKEKSIFRKIREAIIASQIEEILSKEEILEKYFNVVEFGPKIFGIHAAAQYYFSKKVPALTLAEGAWLAMLLPNPTKNNQSFRKGTLSPFAKREMTKIINRLIAFRKISKSDADDALMDIEVFFAKNAAPTKGELELDNLEESSEDSDDFWF